MLFNRYLPKLIFHSPSSSFFLPVHCDGHILSDDALQFESICTVALGQKHARICEQSAPHVHAQSLVALAAKKRANSTPTCTTIVISPLERFLLRDDKADASNSHDIFPVSPICALQVSYPRERHLVSESSTVGRRAISHVLKAKSVIDSATAAHGALRSVCAAQGETLLV